MKSLTLTVLVVAIVASLGLNWIEAQKTIKKTQQQSSRTQVSGAQPNSVYGGYQSSSSSSSQQDVAVAPVQQQQQQSFSASSSSVQSASRPSYQQSQQSSYEESGSEQSASEADAEPASYGSVNGQPGKDFPAYTRIPKTSFSCNGLPYDYGMYADEETGCQAFHVCYNGRKDSFLCGVGTVFNQRILHCDYWYSVDCSKSSQYYSSNAYMGSAQPEPGPAQASGSSVQSSYQQTRTQSVQSQPIGQSSSASVSKASQQWSRNTQQSEENY